jgi:hypothetical protein
VLSFQALGDTIPTWRKRYTGGFDWARYATVVSL